MLPRPVLAASRPAASKHAFTLVETVVSLTLFSLLSLGLFSVVLQIRRVAEANVYENTALTMAQGYVEQVRSLPYTTLVSAATTSTIQLVLKSANGGGAILTDSTGGLLNAGDWASEVVFLDRTTATATTAERDTQPMNFRFQVALTNLNPTAEGVELTLTYETDLPGISSRVLRRTLRTVRSSVPSY